MRKFADKWISWLMSIVISMFPLWKIKEKMDITTSTFLKSVYKQAWHRHLGRFSSWIGERAELSFPYPYFPHLSSIFISQEAKIGRNCTIFQNVTIGSNTLKDSKNSGSPKIGDNCYIGCGAIIIGKIIIGNNCRIGAGAIVTKDIPDDSLVVMDGMKIIHKEGMNNHFRVKNASGQWIVYKESEWSTEEDK